MRDWEPKQITKNWSSAEIGRFCDFWQRLANAGAQKCDEVQIDGKVTLVWSDDYKRAFADFGESIGKPMSQK